MYDNGVLVEIVRPLALEVPPVILSPLTKVPVVVVNVRIGAVASALVSSESNIDCIL